MSRFTDSLQAPGTQTRTVPALRQDRKHVGVYVRRTWHGSSG